MDDLISRSDAIGAVKEERFPIDSDYAEGFMAAQNALQLRAMRSEKGMRENAYQEFVKSLKSTDREFVKRVLEEFMNQEDE